VPARFVIDSNGIAELLIELAPGTRQRHPRDIPVLRRKSKVKGLAKRREVVDLTDLHAERFVSN
jgi:hypothetical protein